VEGDSYLYYSVAEGREASDPVCASSFQSLIVGGDKHGRGMENFLDIATRSFSGSGTEDVE
jgi:hypothetical protein